MRDFDTAVMVGRFAPWRKADGEVLERLLEQAERVVVILGSAQEPRSIQTPWTTPEREAMIRAGIGDNARVQIAAVEDYLYRPQAWRDIVRGHAGAGRIGVYGARGEFRDWDDISHVVQAPSGPQLRQAWLGGETAAMAEAVPAPVYEQLVAIARLDDWQSLTREFKAVQAYRESWSQAPYTPILAVVDSVVVHRDADDVRRLLLVQRGGDFGEGLLAVPGGFVEAEEFLLDAALRELREETGWTVDDPVNRLARRHTFDYPYRSARGRVVSTGFRFDIDGPLPQVQGSDDAQAAEWVPLEQVWRLRHRMFEDHFSLIDHMLQDMR